MAEPADDGELDELTLARARQGDERACRAFVVRYERPVFALLSRLLWRSGREALVEDLAQETFLRAFRALPGFDPSGAARPSTWLLTIATRLALDELRRRPLAVPPMPGISPDHADAGAQRTMLARAVAQLAPDQRAAFLLREAHGFTTAEVAAALGVEEGTVKSRLSRARALLREALGDNS